jgi:hypothetical protein
MHYKVGKIYRGLGVDILVLKRVERKKCISFRSVSSRCDKCKGLIIGLGTPLEENCGYFMDGTPIFKEVKCITK